MQIGARELGTHLQECFELQIRRLDDLNTYPTNVKENWESVECN